MELENQNRGTRLVILMEWKSDDVQNIPLLLVDQKMVAKEKNKELRVIGEGRDGGKRKRDFVWAKSLFCFLFCFILFYFVLFCFILLYFIFLFCFFLFVLLDGLSAFAGHGAKELQGVIERITVEEHVAGGFDGALERETKDAADGVAFAFVKFGGLGVLHR